MSGQTFTSNVEATPAVTATGTNGAQGISASSDGGEGLYVKSQHGTGLHAVGGTPLLQPVGGHSSIPAILAEAGGLGGVGLVATSDGGTSVSGTSQTGVGVVGQSTSNSGVFGTSQTGVGVTGTSNSGHGVSGTSDTQVGVYGQSTSNWGVGGISQTQAGVHGESTSNVGVWGQSESNRGVWGESKANEGVHGVSHSATWAGVAGINDNTQSDGAGPGVWGESTTWDGVHGISHSAQHPGVAGINDNTQSGGKGPGVYGESTAYEGVYGVSHSAENAGIAGTNTAQGGLAGWFGGNVRIWGTVTIESGGDIIFADFSEEFEVAASEDIEPGTVMVLNQHGALQPSQQAYDKKVAGVIAGAGDYRPGLVLGKKESSKERMPVALVGKVYCKVDAQYASIEVGDLLTTSPTPGHAMKADDPFKAFGAVIGKALRPLEAGQGMLPILIALQ